MGLLSYGRADRRGDRPGSAPGLVLAGVCALLATAGCGAAAAKASATKTTTTLPSVTTTLPGPSAGAVQTSGTRTILSPIGLHVRSQPSAAAPTIGTAAQGVTLTVLGHTDQGGGWYQVKGSTVTGYMSDDPTLSTPGELTGYSAPGGSFSTLYPAGWTVSPLPSGGVTFAANSGGDSINVTTAATVSQLTHSPTAYHQVSSMSTVVCGVTGQLITYAQVAGTTPSTVAPDVPAEPYLVEINLTLDAKHALGVIANLAGAADQPEANDVIYSMSFPFAQCLGTAAVPASTTTSTTSK